IGVVCLRQPSPHPKEPHTTPPDTQKRHRRNNRMNSQRLFLSLTSGHRKVFVRRVNACEVWGWQPAASGKELCAAISCGAVKSQAWLFWPKGQMTRLLSKPWWRSRKTRDTPTTASRFGTANDLSTATQLPPKRARSPSQECRPQHSAATS